MKSFVNSTSDTAVLADAIPVAAPGEATDAASDAALKRVFSATGPLARHIPSYRPRPQQFDMAVRIAKAMRSNATLVCEAGTGTGKTVAYLVPALLSGAKVIVSTGTKTLQDQLYHRDLPTVRDALGVPVTAALLKGRANYVCHHHLARNLADGRLSDREAVVQLHKISRFSKVTQSGDRSELSDVPENAPVWGLATSTRENCLGASCGDFDKCFVMQARKRALNADVVVVNHHLFFADVMLRDEGLSELLPACNAVILDEAHQLPETATLFFGESLSTAQLLDLARDVRVAAATVAKDHANLPLQAGELEYATRELRLTLPREGARMTAKQLRERQSFSGCIVEVEGALAPLVATLEAVSERDEVLALCAKRAKDMLDRLRRWRDESRDDLVRWAEAFAQSLQLHATPLDIAPIFRRQLEGRPQAWIFTSATLAVSGNFDHYLGELGLEESATACWESPFDYANNALLYLPKALPDPNSREHTEAVVEAALPAIRASGGRAFLLFTTLRAMRYAHELLQERLKKEDLAFPLLVQGEGSRTELLDRFRKLGNAVLVASSSFWEGVDVRGEALSLVVIDKLPFAPPGDPVLEARLDRISRSGRNAFMEYQLPQTAIALKQGAGRLIRDETDRGVLMICDPRLTGKPYGRRILASLPPMRVTRHAEEVIAFFDAGGKHAEG